jgi:excisionase family DNA binding protein
MPTYATEMLTPHEVAAELRISPSTVYRSLARGELVGLRLGENGRTIRVSREAVGAWLVPAGEAIRSRGSR